MAFLKPVFTICVLMIISNSAFALTQCDGVDEPEDVRIYFVNGMDNQFADMTKSRDALQANLGGGANVIRLSINNKEPRSKKNFRGCPTTAWSCRPKRILGVVESA